MPKRKSNGDDPDASAMRALLELLTQAAPGTLADVYVTERERRDRHADLAARHQKRMDTIAQIIFQKMVTLKVDSFRCEGKGPTVHKYKLTTASCHDPEEFMQFVVDNAEYDLLERRAAKEACEEYAAEHQRPPPGVTLNEFIKLGVRES